MQREPTTRSPISVAESVPAPHTMMAAASVLLATVMASEVEMAALEIIRATTLQPLLVSDAVEAGMSAATQSGSPSEAAAQKAIRHLTATALVQRCSTDSDQRQVLLNPNIWSGGQEMASAALKAADGKGTKEVGALLAEVAASPGMPDAHVTSTEKKWVNFAITQGLIQRTVVQTDDGDEQGFLFTPLLAKDPFGLAIADSSGQVRQLVGSMIYAATFSEIKLYSPVAFIRALVERGVAGNATPIGHDYPMLETAASSVSSRAPAAIASGWNCYSPTSPRVRCRS